LLFSFDAMILLILAVGSAFGAWALSRLRRQVAEAWHQAGLSGPGPDHAGGVGLEVADLDGLSLLGRDGHGQAARLWAGPAASRKCVR
jgi:hypothetical protein